MLSKLQKMAIGFAVVSALVLVLAGYCIAVVESALYVPCHPKARTYLNDPEKATEFEKERKLQLPMVDKRIRSPYSHHRIPGPSQDITLDAWWIPAVKKTQKTVILLHGYRSSKHSPRLLFLAGMYHQAGMNVLLFDYRNHGYSSCPTHRHTAGQEESDDLLAVKKWLVKEQGIASSSIGVHGISLGGLTAMIAMSKDPTLAAVIAETPPYDMKTVAYSELRRQKAPEILIPFIVGLEDSLIRHYIGIDLDKVTAKMGIEKLNNRPLMVLFSTKDSRVPYKGHFDKLVEDAAKYQQPLKIILLEGADHDGFLEYMIPWYEKNVPVFLKDNLVDGKQQKSMKTITHQDILIRTKDVPRELLK